MRSHVGHFSDVLSQSVGAETAWPPCADQWNEDNPFWGNCLVATLVFWGDQDFKGNLIPCLAGEDELWHFQYTSPETGLVDLTASQFGGKEDFVYLSKGTKIYNTVLSESLFNDPSLADRLALLMERMEDNGYSCKASLGDILTHIESRYGSHSFGPAPKTPGL
ncbi:MAG: hypothetical protein CMH28_02585 [Micavibrio sp.]|nr:hypothetical protein [Micavibrio sp.]|tara:strand:- start:253 stop:744 length:492 start_codon:yes stop_codon:yes gene_type:complete